MDNSSKFFQSNIRIQGLDPSDQDAVWPHNVEICLTRVPIRKRDGYSVEYIQNFAKRLKSSMVHNGIVFLVCYAPVEDKARPFEVARAMTAAGFNHIDNIVIQKSWFPGKRSEVNLVNSHEYVLYFCNGDVWNLDRAPIHKYLKVDDSISCAGNTWTIEVGSLDESIPVDLAELLLRMTDCLPGSMVFDVNMGNQATIQACLKLGHALYGFEKDSKKIKRYEKIIEKYVKTGGF